MRDIVIATRRSPLAMWQAEHVAAAIRKATGRGVELLPLVTTGDKILDVPLAKVGGKGLFVKEIEAALLDGRADLAVHSLKDVPTALPPGLRLGAVMEREDPRDALCSPKWKTLDALPQGARVGTSSLRRGCQLLALRKDLEVVSIRGNVQTRLGRLEDLDGILLAHAGLRRLGLEEHATEVIDDERMLPAVGQGALAIEIREDDPAIDEIVELLDHPATGAAVRAERALLARLEGSCQIPLAAYATLDDGGRLTLRARVGRPDGSTLLESRREGEADEAEAMGVAAAEDLLSQGAGAILDELVGKVVGVPH